MGFFSNLYNKAKNFAKDTVKTVKETASKAYTWAKEKAAQACDWIAEKGDKFIDDVKETYKKVKPYLQKARPWLDGIAVAISSTFPWLATGIHVVAKVIDGLFALENSPVAQKLEKGLRWTIKLAQFVKERYLQPEEVAEAKQHQQSFSEFLKQATNLSDEQKRTIELQQMLNNYSIVKVELRDTLEMGVADFQSYLRLRAVQKSLNEADYKLSNAQTIEDISDDDKFLINIAEQLLSTAELSDNEAQRLDEITQKRFGKSLIPFVFEELLMVWVQKHESLEKEWSIINKEVSSIKVQRTRLETAKRISGLTDMENAEYNEICAKLTGQESKLRRVDKERRSMKNYLYAAEGFMQILEKSEEELIAEDRDYLLEDASEVASIIMRVASNNIDWDSLTEDERDMIIAYATIFDAEGKERAKRLAREIEMEI